MKKNKNKEIIQDYKERKFASTPTSIVSSELSKEHYPDIVNRADKRVEGQRKNLSCGILSISEKSDLVNHYSMETDKEILRQFKNIGLSRRELQFFIAIFDIYSANCGNDYVTPICISLKDFHSKILRNSNRLRKSDKERYKNIFKRLSNIFISIDTTTASVYPYKAKEIKKIEIDSLIANVAIISLPELDYDIIKIFPTEYILFELRQSSQISNFLPREFISLKFTKHDNILYFGYYLVRMHKINMKKYKTRKWDMKLKNLIKEAIPHYNYILHRYSSSREKGKYVSRNIIKPLEESLKIIESNKYIKGFNLIVNDSKNIFEDEDQKLEIMFDYSLAKKF